MIQREVMKRLVSIHRVLLPTRNSSSKLNIEKLEQESSATFAEVVDEEDRIREEEIERRRNKSRLRDADRNILHEKNPYPEPMLWHHGTIKYIRRTYGRYGQASGVNPSICWPTKDELNEAKEYERIKHPFTIAEMVAAAKQKRQEKEERILARQADIIKKMAKLDVWTRELQERIAKKENEAKSAKERKDRLIEEVKRHFGYTVDPRDDKFKEMLEKKEKEQKKAMKEERRKAKEAGY
ncbi:growth arrest and DNA damage-inducible proteins-interacting protein 1 [Anoplophora glabripennis]|uniref:growth arrest and DNA damage-inducible proteins-interacting protein 1 n=1 Tax=Anoplophora glabripennis TaxID=217634 RepID=UPI000C768588|nr:growth arrest and DNA damage-inducible proteins-interacting protein 1 [Anoplophora glabripennis]